MQYQSEAPHSACCVQKDMPRNGDHPLVKLSRTGPVYVRLDGIPMMRLGMANGLPPGKLQEQLKADMQRLAAEVLGFEAVHIYSRPLNMPGFAIFVFDNEQGRPKISHDTLQVLTLANHRCMQKVQPCVSTYALSGLLSGTSMRNRHGFKHMQCRACSPDVSGILPAGHTVSPHMLNCQ